MNKPGYDGRFEVDTKAVDDPFDPGNPLAVAVNKRHDIIEWMYSHRTPDGRRIINEAQYRAGGFFLGLLERAEENRNLARDYTALRVDSSRGISDISLDRSGAMRKLEALRCHIGDRDFALVRRVIGDGAPLASTSDGQAEKRYMSRRFKDALTAMAIFWKWDGSALSP